jgi:hypothetical protein
MATTSRIPAATDALLATLSAAIGTTTNVVDGPPNNWDNVELAADSVSESRFLFVGATPDSDTSFDGDQDFNAAGAVSRDEHFTIYLTALAWGGDQVMKTRRDDAFGIVASVETAIRADPSLTGAVLYSRTAGIESASQQQNEHGSQCLVIFTVACRAYLS